MINYLRDIMRKFVLFFVFSFFPVFLFAQNFDKSLYREIGLEEASDIRKNYAGTTQYYKSLAHFDYTYYNNIMGHLNVVVYASPYPSQFTQLRYYRSQSLGITIQNSQIVMLYWRHIIYADGSQNFELDYIEVVNNKYFIVGTAYTIMENLKLRSTGDLSGKVIRTMQRGEFATVINEGKVETIDGITSSWVKVKLNDGTEGWCFGGYLGIRLKD
jgi:hypothetical protein